MDEGRYDQITRLVRETVIMLFKNGVSFERQLKVQGLLGVTVDSGAVFLVHVNETCNTDRCSSSDKSVNYRHSVEASTSSQSCVDRLSEQCPADILQWPRMPEANASQCSQVKQEKEPFASIYDQYALSANAAATRAAATNASLLPVQESGFPRVDDDVVCLESVSNLTPVDNSRPNHDPAAFWNPYPVTPAADRQELGTSDYSARLSTASDSCAPVHADNSQYNAYPAIETEDGDVGMTDYSTSAPKSENAQSMPRQVARRGRGTRMGRGYHKMLPRCGPRLSWHIPQTADAQPQTSFSASDQPSASKYVRGSMQFRRKRGGRGRAGRPPRVSRTVPMSTSADVESSGDDDYKWEMVTLTKFACKLCGCSFNHMSNLRRHQVDIHGRQKRMRRSRGRRSST